MAVGVSEVVLLQIDALLETMQSGIGAALLMGWFIGVAFGP